MGFARLSFDGRHLLVVVAFALSLVAMPAQATVIFDDGEYHDIDTPFEDFQVYDEPRPGTTTWVEVHPGGDISELDGTSVSVFDYSHVIVLGTLRGDLVLFDVSSGRIGRSFSEPVVEGNVEANGLSRLVVQSGIIAGNTDLKDRSRASIWGGIFQGDVECQDTCDMRVFANVVLQGAVKAQDEGEIYVEGGTFQGVISAEDAATVMLRGHDFLVNGTPVDYGPISAREGTIEGTLFFGGDLLSTTFRISDDAQIVLVPEPSTLVLLLVGGIGALAHVWRRQQRPAAGCRR